MVKKYIILTGGDGGTGNLGDEFILAAIKKFYKPYLKIFNIVILKHDLPKHPQQDDFIYINDVEDKFSAHKIPVKDIALVHYFGGGFLNIYWYDAKIWLYRYLTKLGLSPKKFVFTGQGLGPFSQTQKKELKKIATRVSLFGVRDKNSLTELPKTGFSFDDTISLIKPSLKKYSFKKTIGINIRLEHEHAVIERQLLISVLQNVNNYSMQNNYNLYLFSMINNSSYSEIPPQIGLAKEAQIDNFKFFERSKDYKDLLKRIGKSKLIISTSYHVALAAIYTKVPVICLYQNDYYRLKFEGLSKVMNSPLLHVCQINDFNTKLIEKAIQSTNMKNIKLTSQSISMLSLQNKTYFDRIASLLRGVDR